MAAKVFFCGEVVADLLEHTHGSGDFKLMLGGSHYLATVGAAKAIVRENLALKVGYVGAISQDMFGDRFIQVLDDLGIVTSNIKRVPHNTTLALVSIRSGMENAFSFYGENTAEQMILPEDLPEKLCDANDRKVCCFGSISTVIEPARFTWMDYAKRQRQDGLVYYDLNTRPSVAKDPKTYRALVLEWAKVAHVVKASDSDAAWAYPGLSMAEIAKIWLDAGASMAIFTKSAQGAEAYTRNLKLSVETPDLIAKNTVGAGDNFNAGVAMGFALINCLTKEGIEALATDELQEILRRGNEMATIHLMSMGARPRELKMFGP